MLNPRAGVVILQTNLVSVSWITLWTLIPFVFSTVNNSADLSGRPLGDWRTSTELIEFPTTLAAKIPLSIDCPVPVSTITILGGSV